MMWMKGLPCRFALDTVTQEPYVQAPQPGESKIKKILHNPKHPLTVAANVVWCACIFGHVAVAHNRVSVHLALRHGIQMLAKCDHQLAVDIKVAAGCYVHYAG